MKKIILLITLLLFIPSIVNAAECDISKVYIDSIELNSSLGTVVELEDATAKDKTININLGMANVGDNIQYKLKIKNDSTEDYEIDKSSISINSDYINYSFKTEDNSNIIKAKTSKTVLLNVQYKTQVPNTSFKDGTYEDDITMRVNLSSEDQIVNPNTGIKLLVIAIIFIVCGISFIVFGIKRNNMVIVPIIAMLLLIPFSVDALCKCEIQLKSKVNINQSFTGVIVRSSSTVLHKGDKINSRLINCNRDICSYIDKNEYNTKKFYIKHDIVENKIIKSYVCTGSTCLVGATTTDFENNKELFFSLPDHDEDHCDISDDRIYNSGHHDYIEREGNVRLGNYCGECKVNADGSSNCVNLDSGAC